MKCPGCAFVSSDNRDICPKCFLDLRPAKTDLGLPITAPEASYRELLARLVPRAAKAATPKVEPAGRFWSKFKTAITELKPKPSTAGGESTARPITKLPGPPAQAPLMPQTVTPQTYDLPENSDELGKILDDIIGDTTIEFQQPPKTARQEPQIEFELVFDPESAEDAEQDPLDVDADETAAEEERRVEPELSAAPQEDQGSPAAEEPDSNNEVLAEQLEQAAQQSTEEVSAGENFEAPGPIFFTDERTHAAELLEEAQPEDLITEPDADFNPSAKEFAPDLVNEPDGEAASEIGADPEDLSTEGAQGQSPADSVNRTEGPWEDDVPDCAEAPSEEPARGLEEFERPEPSGETELERSTEACFAEESASAHAEAQAAHPEGPRSEAPSYEEPAAAAEYFPTEAAGFETEAEPLADEAYAAHEHPDDESSTAEEGFLREEAEAAFEIEERFEDESPAIEEWPHEEPPAGRLEVPDMPAEQPAEPPSDGQAEVPSEEAANAESLTPADGEDDLAGPQNQAPADGLSNEPFEDAPAPDADLENVAQEFQPPGGETPPFDLEKDSEPASEVEAAPPADAPPEAANFPEPQTQTEEPAPLECEVSPIAPTAEEPAGDTVPEACWTEKDPVSPQQEDIAQEPNSMSLEQQDQLSPAELLERALAEDSALEAQPMQPCPEPHETNAFSVDADAPLMAAEEREPYDVDEGAFPIEAEDEDPSSVDSEQAGLHGLAAQSRTQELPRGVDATALIAAFADEAKIMQPAPAEAAATQTPENQTGASGPPPLLADFDDALAGLKDSGANGFEMTAEEFSRLASKEEMALLFDVADEAILNPEFERQTKPTTSAERKVEKAALEKTLQKVEKALNVPQLNLKGTAKARAAQPVMPIIMPSESLRQPASLRAWLRASSIDAANIIVWTAVLTGLCIWRCEPRLEPYLFHPGSWDVLTSLSIAGIFCGMLPFGSFVYMVWRLIAIEQTQGEALLGLKVVRADGKPAEWHHALLRAATFLPSVCLGGGIPLLYGRQSAHDFIAGTMVAVTSKADA